MRSKLYTLLFLFVATVASAQPLISNIDRASASTGEKVIISGSGFGTTPADVIVYFGAVKGQTLNVTDQLIEASVPEGTTYEQVTVTRNGLTAFAPAPVLLNYHGEHPFLKAKLEAKADLDAEAGLFDLCLCDLDGDNLSDLGGVNSGNSLGPPPFALSLFRNTSTPGTFSFAAKVSLIPGVRALHIECGDLDGDGKKDLVISEADPGNRLFILRNTSTPGSLSLTMQNITLAGTSPKRVDIADIDKDGKPDLVVTDQKSGNNQVMILPNTSTAGTISFGTRVSISLGAGSLSSDGLAVTDINGDTFADVILTQFLTANSNVFVLENKSSPGNFSFASPVVLTLSGTPVNVRAADIDGDGKADLAVTQLLASAVTVFVNQSTASEIKFAPPVPVATDQVPWGIDVGDMDGDAKPDLIVASLTGTGSVNPKSITVLNNTSTPGTVSFVPAAGNIVPTTFVNRHVAIGDVDGDGRPDVSYTSIDDNNRAIAASKISFFRNTSCVKPRITPDGAQTICSGFTLRLDGTKSPGATYLWRKDGTSTGITTDFIEPSASGTYALEITRDGCTKLSDGVAITVVAGAALPAPGLSSNAPVCVGATLNLTASSAGATGYEWTGPASFTASGASVSRPGFEATHAGRYDVIVMSGSCVAAKGSILVETITLPVFQLSTDTDLICNGSSKVLSVSPNAANFTYQWFDANGAISGETGTTLNVAASGTYMYKATSTLYPGCLASPSDEVTLTVVDNPVVAFNAPPQSCKDNVVTFTNQSTVAPNAGVTYTWTFGDAGTSDAVSPTHTYTATGNFNVKLVVAYRNNSCPKELTKAINIVAAPVATITSEGNRSAICAGGELELGVSASFTSYLWSTQATTPAIVVTAPGAYSVTLTNSIGCVVTANKNITALPSPTVSITATPPQVNIGETTQLEATPGLATYEWTPVESLTNATIQNPVASPEETTTYTVLVTNADGCEGTATKEVVVTFDDITNLLKPSNFFTPNGSDQINPVWEVGNILSFPQCSVVIVDDKGQKVYEAKPYLNDWDGTRDGKQLPSGVYYYLIRCDGETKTKAGSITLIR